MAESIVRFVENAAGQSKYHSAHWFRYLRKIVENGSIPLTPEELNRLMVGNKLTLFQKVSLKQAMKKDTPTNRYVTGLNKRTTTPMLREIMMRNRHV